MKITHMTRQIFHKGGFARLPFVVLFIVLSAVSANAQTPLRPIFSARQPDVSEEPPPADSAEQQEASEESSPVDFGEQTETSDDSLPEYSPDQTKTSEDSPPELSDVQPEISLPGQTVVRRPDFFIAPLAEITGYTRDGVSFGAGFALGGGNGVAIGSRFLYVVDFESIHTIEITVFMRFYLQGAEACTGPFIQLNAGAAIHNHKHGAFAFAGVGAHSAGIAAGWRFLLGERWYIEPYIRIGYSYIAAAGVAFALRL
ncbi:MAG: autotransporter outer membrane beta-barrel domain-containing protein [Treponema sp.]|nr:autotransporter outer membrane beta-barrel domain-containing protein [Treponema sp.]